MYSLFDTEGGLIFLPLQHQSAATFQMQLNLQKIHQCDMDLLVLCLQCSSGKAMVNNQLSCFRVSIFKMAIMGYPIGKLLPSIIFPVSLFILLLVDIMMNDILYFQAICFGSIYADWSHTREWKRQQRLQLEILESVRREEISD